MGPDDGHAGRSSELFENTIKTSEALGIDEAPRIELEKLEAKFAPGAERPQMDGCKNG